MGLRGFAALRAPVPTGGRRSKRVAPSGRAAFGAASYGLALTS